MIMKEMRVFGSLFFAILPLVSLQVYATSTQSSDNQAAVSQCCRDKNNVTHGCETTWEDQMNPCVFYYCNEGVISKYIIECPAPTYASGECCIHHENENICKDRYGYQESGANWMDQEDPCVFHHCRDGEIFTAIIDCGPPPCDVNPVLNPGACCPHYPCQ